MPTTAAKRRRHNSERSDRALVSLDSVQSEALIPETTSPENVEFMLP